MSDIYDKILEKLPPSTIRFLSNYNGERWEPSTNVYNLLQEFQNVEIKRVNGELKRKISDILFKTSENRNYLLKLKKELEVLKSLKKTPVNDLSVKAYTAKINELENTLSSLTKDHNNVDLTDLFNSVEELNQQVEEYKKKISEAKSKYQSYDGFPPDIEEAKKLIAEIKERIKRNETIVETYFQS